jgi:hypothetical protein
MKNLIYPNVDSDSYTISTDGTIISKHSKNPIKQTIRKGNRTISVTLKSQEYKNKLLSFTLARIVAHNFIGESEGIKMIRYKDGNPHNVHVDNLEWYFPEEEYDDVELWKIIEGSEGKHLISSHGRGISLIFDEPKLITIRDHFIKRNGNVRNPDNPYKYMATRFNGKQGNQLVHRMVAWHFIPHVEGKDHVNHIDGNKSNNHVSNLEWVSDFENQLHAYNTGLKKLLPRRPVRQYHLGSNKTVNTFTSIEEAARQTGIYVDCIRNTCSDRPTPKSAGGFGWEYLKLDYTTDTH